jgi:predicted RNA-binding protein with PUA-like domain
VAARGYWLFKSEPRCYSFDDLMSEPDRRGRWDGIRSYQARNFIRDRMAIGDGVLFYHSSCAEPGIVGTAQVCSEASIDPTQFDKSSDGYDPKSKRSDPTWWLVEIEAIEKFRAVLALSRMRKLPELETMPVLRRGNRLSITPVTKKEWDAVLRIAKSRD